MTIQEMRDKLAAEKAAAEAVVATADADQGGVLTEEQETTVDQHIRKFTDLKNDIRRIEHQGTQRSAIDQMAGSMREQATPAPVQAQPSTTPPAESARRGVGRVQLASENDPQRGFARPSDFILAVIGWDAKGIRDERLLPLQAAAGGDEQSTFSDPYGGFLVPEGFLPNLMTVAAEGDILAGKTMQIPMASPTVNIPARVDKNHTSSVSGGLQAKRRAEADSASATRTEYENVQLAATSLTIISHVTEELLADSAVSFAALLEQGAGAEFGAKLMDERLNGTGAGEFLGVNNSPCLVTVAKEGSQAADTILHENVVKMRSRCWGYQDAIWLANHDCYPQLSQMHIAVTTSGGPSPTYQSSLIDDRPDMLLGRPIFYSEFAETVGDVGDIVLGNWTQYLEGTYQAMGSAESMHVRFVNHERTFKFFMRNAGTPWWRSALTVKKGSNSLSPFVRLAVRA